MRRSRSRETISSWAACSIAALALLAGCSEADEAQETRFASLLRAEAGVLRSTHSLPYRFEASGPYTLTDVSDRQDMFNGVPYNISRAAFISEDAAVMVHAETVADKSGASNYDELPLADWPAPGFRSEGSVCIVLSDADVEGEADPEWLSDNGFDVVGALSFGQYFLSSPDYNDELVVSLFVRVPSCGQGPGEEALEGLRAEFSARRL